MPYNLQFFSLSGGFFCDMPHLLPFQNGSGSRCRLPAALFRIVGVMEYRSLLPMLPESLLFFSQADGRQAYFFYASSNARIRLKLPAVRLRRTGNAFADAVQYGLEIAILCLGPYISNIRNRETK